MHGKIKLIGARRIGEFTTATLAVVGGNDELFTVEVTTNDLRALAGRAETSTWPAANTDDVPCRIEKPLSFFSQVRTILNHRVPPEQQI